jgi:Hypothetical glycosyl hydrolase family 15
LLVNVALARVHIPDLSIQITVLTRALKLAIGGCALVITCTSVVSAASGLSSARAARPIAGIAVLRLGSSAGAQRLHRYSYVLLGKGQYHDVGRIKRLSPTTKVLSYTTATGLMDDCAATGAHRRHTRSRHPRAASRRWCPGITYQEAQAHDAHHPDDRWILTSASGKSLIAPHAPHNHLANIGSASYRRTWASRVRAAAVAKRFDGILIDGVTARPPDWTRGRHPTAYPSDGVWKGAMRRFVRFVGPPLKARGLYVLADTFKGGSTGDSADVAWWKTVAPYVDGLMAEHWEQSRTSNVRSAGNRWYSALKLATAAHRSGADFFPLQYGSSADVRTMTYGKASFLLVWDGSGGGYIFNPQSRADPWNAAWTTPIGKPTGSRRRVGVGWRRNYTRGVVLVNPDPTTVQRFSLGERYSGRGRASLTSATLQPVSAMILRKRAGSGVTRKTDTSVIDDEGTVRMGTAPTSMTNGNKFATLALGGHYNIFRALPGRTVKYTSGTFCFDGDDVGESKATCRANGWLVHNSSGQEITYYSGSQTIVNLGNVSFQNDLKQRMLNFLAAHPWIDGVYFDDGAVSVTQVGGSYPIYDQNNNLLWSNDTDYRKAQISFLSNVGAALKARGYAVGYSGRGFLAGDNRSDNGELAKWWIDRYAPYVTATMIEYWHQGRGVQGIHTVDLSGDDTWYNHWDGWQSVEAYAQSKGLEFWPIDYIAKSGEDSQCRYLRGSYLLDWNGKGSILLVGWDGSDFWNSCTATDLGFPTGAKRKVASGVWRRDYTRGYVIVNPTKSTVAIGSDTIPSGDAILHQK